MRLLFVRGTVSSSAFLQQGQDRYVRCSLVVFVVIAHMRARICAFTGKAPLLPYLLRLRIQLRSTLQEFAR